MMDVATSVYDPKLDVFSGCRKSSTHVASAAPG
jgi:hypothetical protein